MSGCRLSRTRAARSRQNLGRSSGAVNYREEKDSPFQFACICHFHTRQCIQEFEVFLQFLLPPLLVCKQHSRDALRSNICTFPADFAHECEERRAPRVESGTQQWMCQALPAREAQSSAETRRAGAACRQALDGCRRAGHAPLEGARSKGRRAMCAGVPRTLEVKELP